MAPVRQIAIVTGGAGFIGSHLVDALLADARRVIVVDDLSSGSADRVAGAAELEVLDVVDFAALARLLDTAAPGAVFHLAGQPSVTASVADPQRDCAVNVGGTLNVLAAAARVGAPVLFASTGGALYGDSTEIPTREDRPPAPISPYGASKWAAEIYVSTWSRSSGAPHAICRLGNVYGPRQSAHGDAGVVAIFSHRLWQGRPPTLFGDGRPSRDYIHVSDVVEAMLRAEASGATFNVATGTETPTRDLLAALQRAAGTELEPELAPLRPGELRRSRLDPSWAEQRLGWRPRVGLARGLAATYEALASEFDAAAAAGGRGGAQTGGGSPPAGGQAAEESE